MNREHQIALDNSCDCCGPQHDAESFSIRVAELADDDSEIVDCLACADWLPLDALLPTAYRTGDWSAYTAAVSAQIAAQLVARAGASA